MQHRPVCVKCETVFRPETTGVGLLDMFNPSNKPDPQPYRFWEADLYKCPKCGAEIVVGFGSAPTHHIDTDFKKSIAFKQKNNKLYKNY